MKKAIKLFPFILVFLLLWHCENSDDSPAIESAQIACLPVDLQSDVIAFYPFNNGSLNDESGNNFNLANNTSASPTSDREGNINCAYNFDFSNEEFLEYENPTFLDDLPMNGFTVCFWYKITGNFGSGMFIKRDEGLNCTLTDGQWSLIYVDGVMFFGVNGKITSSNVLVNDSDWEHIAISATGTELKFYINGILIAEEIASYSCDVPNPTLNQGDLFIGKFLDGQLDDIVIFDRELNSSEINSIYNSSPCCL